MKSIKTEKNSQRYSLYMMHNREETGYTDYFVLLVEVDRLSALDD